MRNQPSDCGAEHQRMRRPVAERGDGVESRVLAVRFFREPSSAFIRSSPTQPRLRSRNRR